MESPSALSEKPQQLYPLASVPDNLVLWMIRYSEQFDFFCLSEDSLKNDGFSEAIYFLSKVPTQLYQKQTKTCH